MPGTDAIEARKAADGRTFFAISTVTGLNLDDLLPLRRRGKVELRKVSPHANCTAEANMICTWRSADNDALWHYKALIAGSCSAPVQLILMRFALLLTLAPARIRE